jgi:SNF2 family DNA or RNA helicase
VIWIERRGNRIVANVPWDAGAGPLEAKAVAGARPQHKSGRFTHWTYPLDLNTCRALRSQFTDRLDVGPELIAWARQELSKQEGQTRLREATDADLSVVPRLAPVLAAAMANRPYQKVGARFIVEGRNVLVADEPGLGKTLETLAAMVEAGVQQVVIFAKKKAVTTVWAPEIKRWLGDLAEVWVLTGTGEQRNKILAEFLNRPADNKIHFVVTNIEMVRWSGIKEKSPHPNFPMLFTPTWHAIVVDESHKALIGKHTMSKSITQARYGMMKLKIIDGGIKVALSGTPSRGKMVNLWGTLNWLQPKVFTGYSRWVEMFFEFSEGQFGGREIGEIREDKLEDFDKALAPIMLRRTKAEVAPELPRKQYGGSPLDPEDPEATLGIWGEMSARQKRAYKTILEDGVVKFAGGGNMNANGTLAELARRKQWATCEYDKGVKKVSVTDETGKPRLVDKEFLIPKKGTSWKFDWIMELEEELGSKLVVFSQFTQILNAFHEWANDAGVESLIITGETSARKSELAVKQFNDQQHTSRIIFVNTIAGGESINLDACCDTAVFVDETFIPDDQNQAEDRIHRMSRIHQVVIYYLRSLDSIEEVVCRVTGAREAIVKGRLDGSRGKMFKKIMLEE